MEKKQNFFLLQIFEIAHVLEHTSQNQKNQPFISLSPMPLETRVYCKSHIHIHLNSFLTMVRKPAETIQGRKLFEEIRYWFTLLHFALDNPVIYNTAQR